MKQFIYDHRKNIVELYDIWETKSICEENGKTKMKK